MEGEELQTSRTCLQSYSKLVLWIIEYVWAHNMIHILEVLDSSHWLETEIDSHPLSLEDSLSLRVGSARVFFIVKCRNSQQFEKVIGFLENTYRLLPRLVSPIKHMKIMFGLKTMVIMRMLKERRGLVDTVFKINQLFPSKLPQYQDQCSQRQMFLMKKNHLDFKAFTQALALEKDKLEDYMKNQMEDQYGEHYVQKVEDRLLNYLHRLDTVLPGDTYADKMLKRESPETEEEKMLFKVVTSDSTTIATTLKKLLHCDVSCFVLVSKNGNQKTETSLTAESAPHGSISRTPLQGKSQQVSKDSQPLMENENDPDLRTHQQMEEDGGMVRRVEEENRDQSSTSPASPQFCSKHQRWVKSILQECPVECSEELQLLANVSSSSPPLFRSSSSGSSSEDLTPSNLIQLPFNQQYPPSQTSTRLQTSKPASPEDLRGAMQSGMLSPVVRLIDIASTKSFCTIFKHQQASPNHNQQAASGSSPRVLTSGDEAIHHKTTTDSPFNQSEAFAPKHPPNSTHEVQPAAVSLDESTSPCCRLQTRRWSSRVSKRSRSTSNIYSDSERQAGLSVDRSAPLGSSCPLTEFNVSGPLERDASTSTSQSGRLISLCADNRISLSSGLFQHVVLPKSEPLSQEHISPSNTLPSFHVISPNSNRLSVTSETSRVQRTQLKLSLRSQAMLLQSKLLQPYVSLVRLSVQECDRETEGVQWTEDNTEEEEEEEEEEEGDDDDSMFDVNALYSSSSDSDSEYSLRCDPDYKPSFKRRRLLLEYEASRSVNSV
ncbi:uncharacterized protein LOC117814464 [Notolabrus celidotus]|uniref:uncharacterized protein LOC117814464 n=1 Tax=Notolabrus celidotus TaxID=1203425 RepID=UPI00148FB0C2|nr:uncharacterized protein LOC117814464 [Notolabrus celidotus]